MFSVSSVSKSCLTLLICGLQHTGLPCPSLSPTVCSDSCSLSGWCHPTISSSVIPFSSCPVFPNVSALHIRWPKQILTVLTKYTWKSLIKQYIIVLSLGLYSFFPIFSISFITTNVFEARVEKILRCCWRMQSKFLLYNIYLLLLVFIWHFKNSAQMDLNVKWSDRDVFMHLFTKPAFMEHPQYTRPCEKYQVSSNSRAEWTCPHSVYHVVIITYISIVLSQSVRHFYKHLCYLLLILWDVLLFPTGKWDYWNWSTLRLGVSEITTDMYRGYSISKNRHLCIF